MNDNECQRVKVCRTRRDKTLCVLVFYVAEDKLAGASEGRQGGRTGRSAFHENPLEESHALVTPAVSAIHPASGGLIRAKHASKSRQDKTPGTTDTGSPESKGEFCQRRGKG